jgi:hypothetical protein
VTSEAEEVVSHLGGDVVAAILGGRESASIALKEFKQWSPKRFRALGASSLHGLIHDWYFDSVRDALDGSDRARVVSGNLTGDCIVVDDEFVVMFKKHDSDHRIRSYATKAARAYHSGLTTLAGMRLTTLTAGYLFDDSLNEVGTSVISFRRGLRRKPDWCFQIESDAASPAGYTLNPVIEPPLPLIEVEPLRRPAEGTRNL